MLGSVINKIELALILPGLRKRLTRSLPCGTLNVVEGVNTIGWLFEKFAKASNEQYEEFFRSLSTSFYNIADLMVKEDIMAKFELGITVGEITGMLPEILAEAWAAYSDDKKISVDEGVILVAAIMRQMAEAADDLAVADFFVAQAGALEALAPFFEEEVAPE